MKTIYNPRNKTLEVVIAFILGMVLGFVLGNMDAIADARLAECDTRSYWNQKCLHRPYKCDEKNSGK